MIIPLINIQIIRTNLHSFPIQQFTFGGVLNLTVREFSYLYFWITVFPYFLKIHASEHYFCVISRLGFDSWVFLLCTRENLATCTWCDFVEKVQLSLFSAAPDPMPRLRYLRPVPKAITAFLVHAAACQKTFPQPSLQRLNKWLHNT